MSHQVIVQMSHFYCYLDEKFFFEWLGSISGVENVDAGPQGLVLRIANTGLNRDDWADILGLFARYGVDMRPLRDLVTPENEVWLKDPEKYWHAKMWGPESA